MSPAILTLLSALAAVLGVVGVYSILSDLFLRDRSRVSERVDYEFSQKQRDTVKKSPLFKNLGKMYGTYTGAFLGFIVLLAILEQVGVPNKVLGYLFVFFTLAVYAVIGVMTRTAEVSEYYVAGRRVPAFYNGMATGADWMSAASFVGMAGSLFLLGYDLLRDDHPALPKDSQESRSQDGRIFFFAAPGRVCFMAILLTHPAGCVSWPYY